MNKKAFQVRQGERPPAVPEALTPDDVMAQVGLIQDVMRRAMQEGEHYGIIPGTSGKPTLFKAGAEKLNLTFRMAPDLTVEVVDLGRGHREYQVKCDLYSIATGKKLGSGVGSASTMESKWRFRTAASAEFTGKPVPKEYWDIRKTDPGRALELLGGKGHIAKKHEAGHWEIAKVGEKVEIDNPADYYNTCLKMAKKRALVDAILTVTAASDIFTQDIEDMVPEGVPFQTPEEPLAIAAPEPETAGAADEKPPVPPERAPSPAGEPGKGPRITNAQGRMLYARFRAKGIQSLEAMDNHILDWFGTRLFDLPKGRFDEAKGRIESLPAISESQLPPEDESARHGS
jgi:hypothetical protein